MMVGGADAGRGAGGRRRARRRERRGAVPGDAGGRVRGGCGVAATAIAMALPWNAWLGVATVPGGVVRRARRGGGAIAIEPGARTRAVGRGRRSARRRCRATRRGRRARVDRRRSAAWQRRRRGTSARRDGAALRHARSRAVAGPSAWMAWNAHAHGSALHFIARVTRVPAGHRRGGRAARSTSCSRTRARSSSRPPRSPCSARAGRSRASGQPRASRALALASGSRARRSWRSSCGATCTTARRRITPRARWRDLVDARRHGRRRGGDVAERLVPRAAGRRGGRAAALAGLAWCASLPARWADVARAQRRRAARGARSRGGSTCARGTCLTSRSRRARSSTSRCSPRGEPRSAPPCSRAPRPR